MKHCKSCGVEKPLSEFYKNHAKCMICYNNKRYAKGRKELRDFLDKGIRVCNTCKEAKPFEDFDYLPNKQRRPARCKICKNARIRHKYHKDPVYIKTRQQRLSDPIRKEAKLQAVRDWRKRNPEKSSLYRAKREALLDTGHLSEKDLTRIKNIYRRAQLMTKIFKTPYEVDHYFPLSKGGLHVPSNLFIIKQSINRAKFNNLPYHKFY